MKSEELKVDIGLLTTAHELKSPISLLRQLALSLDLPTTDPTATAAQMVSISDRTLAQIDDLLSIARLSDGLFELEPVNPRTICDSLVSSLQLPTPATPSQIKTTYQNRHRLAIANHTLLRSVIINFLTNATKYGTLTRLAITDHRGRIRISIRDHGPALPAPLAHTINHGQIENPLPTPLRPGSSGLGLFIATRFAAHMSAPITTTRHRDGTSFHLDLPVSRQLSLC